MQATTIPLATLLTPRERFVAPLYQRPYVWERERNWEPFWETVRDVAVSTVRILRRAVYIECAFLPFTAVTNTLMQCRRGELVIAALFLKR